MSCARAAFTREATTRLFRPRSADRAGAFVQASRCRTEQSYEPAPDASLRTRWRQDRAGTSPESRFAGIRLRRSRIRNRGSRPRTRGLLHPGPRARSRANHSSAICDQKRPLARAARPSSATGTKMGKPRGGHHERTPVAADGVGKLSPSGAVQNRMFCFIPGFRTGLARRAKSAPGQPRYCQYPHVLSTLAGYCRPMEPAPFAL